ncbi:thiol-disulfide oxidoreductase DCC family protein [Tritonibacter mobilis]|uniref:thiol-disulfide oxidoreductase DCC family protein n=1 Tax=Tritonibacter mobilis TaxID=379347 RepID=UPI001CD9E09E|nr:DUF393 domain-containing protein [Tritonibacter mobilis]MCA2008664.1 DUF393 domain-containing protein [Tritonibacter mobilis]
MLDPVCEILKEPSRLTVYYDGACPLCRSEAGFYSTRRGAEAIRFVDASDSQQSMGGNLDRCVALSRFHVRLPCGALVSGATGFVAIWNVLPGWRWLARVARWPGMSWLLERAYRGFLVIRPTLSRLFGTMIRQTR